MEDLFVLRDGQYVDVGVILDRDVLYDGIWAVEKNASGRHLTNLSYIRELAEGTNLSDFEKIDAYSCANKILSSKECDELTSKPISLINLVTFVVGKVYEYNK